MNKNSSHSKYCRSRNSRAHTICPTYCYSNTKAKGHADNAVENRTNKDKCPFGFSAQLAGANAQRKTKNRKGWSIWGKNRLKWKRFDSAARYIVVSLSFYRDLKAAAERSADENITVRQCSLRPVATTKEIDWAQRTLHSNRATVLNKLEWKVSRQSVQVRNGNRIALRLKAKHFTSPTATRKLFLLRSPARLLLRALIH